MQWNEVSKGWKDLKASFKGHWPKLDDADLTAIAGKRDELIERLHKHYKTEKGQLGKDVDAFIKTLKVGAR